MTDTTGEDTGIGERTLDFGDQEMACWEDYEAIDGYVPTGGFRQLQHYVRALNALGEEHRFVAALLLYYEDEKSAKELEVGLDREEQGLHYHLEKLVKAGLVENRKETARDQGGAYSYYKLSPFGTRVVGSITKWIEADADAVDTYVQQQQDHEISSHDNSIPSKRDLGRTFQKLLATDDKELRILAIQLLDRLAKVSPSTVTPAVDELVDLLDESEPDVRLTILHTLALIANELPSMLPTDIGDILKPVEMTMWNSDTIDTETKVECLHRIISIYQSIEKRDLEARAQLVTGAVHLQIEGSEKEAGQHLHKSQQLFTEGNNPIGVAFTEYYLGDYFKITNNISKACTHYDQALSLLNEEEFEDDYDSLKTAAHLKIAILLPLEQEQAIESHLQDVLALSEESDLAVQRAEALQMLGEIKFDTNPQEARDLYTEGLELVKEVGNKKLVATLYQQLGANEAELGNYESALSHFESSMEVANTAGLDRVEADNLSNIALTNDRMGDIRNAIEYYELSIAKYVEINAYHESAVDIKRIVEILLADGNEETAIDWIDKGLRMTDIGETSELTQKIRRELQIKRAQLLDSAEELENLYKIALDYMQADERENAIRLLDEIWEHHTEVEQGDAVYDITISAGVGVVGYLKLLEIDETSDHEAEIIDTIEDNIQGLRPGARMVYDVLVSETPGLEEDTIHQSELTGMVNHEYESFQTLQDKLFTEYFDADIDPKFNTPGADMSGQFDVGIGAD